MVVQTVVADPQLGYINGLAQSAIDFGNEIGIDAGQLAAIVEILTCPIDE